MIVSNKISDEKRHFIQNLILSGQGVVRDKNGKLPVDAGYELIIENGFVVDARRILRKQFDNFRK